MRCGGVWVGLWLTDFGDAVVLPGLVDSHVHINEPGRTEWEGFETATRAAAAGGVTMLVDMPLNCVPETIDVEALEAKRAAAQGKTWVDWAAWGGVIRGNAQELKRWPERGFRAQVLPDSLGIDGFKWVGEADLRLALASCAERACRCWRMLSLRAGGSCDGGTGSDGRGLAKLWDLSSLAAGCGGG